jgi:serpin B
MVVVLPDGKPDEKTLQRAINRLSANTWARWADKFSNETVALAMPKLKLSKQYDLMPVLDATGIPIGAYNRLVKPPPTDPVVVDYARQDTFLEIDEKGTKAAAVTVIGTMASAGGISGVPFVVDRPYILALEDSETGSILFTAIIRDPGAK